MAGTRYQNRSQPGASVTTETQEDRSAMRGASARQMAALLGAATGANGLQRPVGAEPDVEERFRALQLTDERLQAHINDLTNSVAPLKSKVDGVDEQIAALVGRVGRAESRSEAAWTEIDYHAKRMNDYHLRLDALEASQSPRSDLYRRLTSRKFLLALITFIGSIVGGLSGWIPPEVAAVLATAIAGLYALAEAWVDNGTEKAKAEVAKAVASLRPPTA